VDPDEDCDFGRYLVVGHRVCDLCEARQKCLISAAPRIGDVGSFGDFFASLDGLLETMIDEYLLRLLGQVAACRTVASSGEQTSFACITENRPDAAC